MKRKKLKSCRIKIKGRASAVLTAVFIILMSMTACDAVNDLARSIKKTESLKRKAARGLMMLGTTPDIISFHAYTEFASAASDKDGNSYAAGNISGSGMNNFGNGVLVKEISGGYNPLLVKFNHRGTAEWARTLEGDAAYSRFNSVAVDSAGNVYAAGFISTQVSSDFGDGVTAIGVNSDPCGVLVKYDSSGMTRWALAVTGTDEWRYSEFHSVAVDAGNNVYVAGTMEGTSVYDFGNGVTAHGASTSNNPVLIKYNSSGRPLWAQTTVTGWSGSEYSSVAVDADGFVYAAGFIGYGGTFNFGNDVTVSGTSDDIAVLVKYDSSGQAHWAQKVPCSAMNGSITVAVASDGVYAAGSVKDNNTYEFGNEVSVTGACPYDNCFIIKFNSSGQAQWARSVSQAAGSSGFESLSVDAGGNVYAAGYMYGNGLFNFGDGVTSFGLIADYNPVLVKYNSSGQIQWTKTASDPSGSSRFFSVVAAGDNTIYAAGFASGDHNFDFGGFFVPRGYSAVLINYASTGEPRWLQHGYH